MAEYVPISELAARLGLDRSSARKYVNKSGFTFVTVRTPESRGQPTLALTAEDADAVEQLRESQGYGPGAPRPAEDGFGVFYVVALVPDLDPRRLKFGFASNVDARLAAHRTAAPTAELLKSWPCRRVWEPAAMASVTRDECEAIGPEVFACHEPAAVVARGDAFFSLMPIP